jgi:hypothetical protein
MIEYRFAEAVMSTGSLSQRQVPERIGDPNYLIANRKPISCDSELNMRCTSSRITIVMARMKALARRSHHHLVAKSVFAKGAHFLIRAGLWIATGTREEAVASESHLSSTDLNSRRDFLKEGLPLPQKLHGSTREAP